MNAAGFSGLQRERERGHTHTHTQSGICHGGGRMGGDNVVGPMTPDVPAGSARVQALCGSCGWYSSGSSAAKARAVGLGG